MFIRRLVAVPLMLIAACFMSTPQQTGYDSSAVKIDNSSEELVTVYAVTDGGFKYRIDEVMPNTIVLRWLPQGYPPEQGVRFLLHPFASARYINDFLTDPVRAASNSVILLKIGPYWPASYATIIP